MERNSNQTPQVSHHKQKENSYESFEEFCLEDRASGNRKIYEKTTSEVTMSKSTTTTFSCGQQNSSKHINSGNINNVNNNYTKKKPKFENEERENYQRTRSPGLPRYHKDDIRLYTRYDDSYVFGQNNANSVNKGSKRPKMSQEKINSNFLSVEKLESNIHHSRDFSYNSTSCNNNNKELNWATPAQSTSCLVSQPQNYKDDTFTTQYFPHTLTPPHSSKWKDELEEEEILYSKFEEYNHQLYEKQSSPSTKTSNQQKINLQEKNLEPFNSSKNFTNAKQKKKKIEDFYSLSDAEMELLPRPSSILKTNQELRLIDYDTYRREVEQLQRKSTNYGNLSVQIDEPIPLVPAVIISNHKSRRTLQENDCTLKYFTKSDLDLNATLLRKTPRCIKLPPVLTSHSNIRSVSSDRVIDNKYIDTSIRSKSETRSKKINENINAVNKNEHFKTSSELYREVFKSNQNIKKSTSTPSNITTTAHVYANNSSITVTSDIAKPINLQAPNVFRLPSNLITEVSPYRESSLGKNKSSQNIGSLLLSTNELVNQNKVRETTTFLAIDPIVVSQQTKNQFEQNEIKKSIHEFKENEREEILESFYSPYQVNIL